MLLAGIVSGTNYAIWHSALARPAHYFCHVSSGSTLHHDRLPTSPRRLRRSPSTNKICFLPPMPLHAIHRRPKQGTARLIKQTRLRAQRRSKRYMGSTYLPDRGIFSDPPTAGRNHLKNPRRRPLHRRSVINDLDSRNCPGSRLHRNFVGAGWARLK